MLQLKETVRITALDYDSPGRSDWGVNIDPTELQVQEDMVGKTGKVTAFVAEYADVMVGWYLVTLDDGNAMVFNEDEFEVTG